MEVYRHDIGAVQQVSSLIVQCSADVLITAVLVAEHDDGPLAAQATRQALPAVLSQGYNRIVFAGSVYARYLELIGTGLNAVSSVSVNELTFESATMQHIQAAGDVDGVNTLYQSPTDGPFIALLVNGLTQLEGLHFTRVDDRTVEMHDAPLIGDIVTMVLQG